jgi:LEA14-like dessication related protein
MHRRDVTIILLCTLLLAGCTGLFFDEPTITLKEIHVRQLSLTDASLVFVAEIQNPNRYELRLKSLDYTVHLNDRETGGGSLQKEISVPASSSAPVEIPVTARFGSLGEVAKMYISGQELPYRIEGKALVKAGLFDRTFPFSRTGTLSTKKS